MTRAPSRAGGVLAERPGPPLRPLADLLRAAGEGGFPLGVPPELRADEAEPGWRPLGEELVAEQVDRTATRWNAPPHVAAALWWKGYSYWATLPVVFGWGLNRRVPLMPYAQIRVRIDADEMKLAVGEPVAAVLAGDPSAGEPGAVPVADEEALLETVRATLLRDHLASLVGMLHELTRVGERTLWGSVAEAVVHPLIAFGEPLTGTPADVWERRAVELLDGLGGPVAGLAEVTPGRAVRRRTCCLWVALPDTTACPSCCVNR